MGRRRPTKRHRDLEITNFIIPRLGWRQLRWLPGSRDPGRIPPELLLKKREQTEVGYLANTSPVACGRPETDPIPRVGVSG